MSEFSVVHPNCAGIDIGSEKIFIGVENKEVVNFGTFTDDYLRAISFLKEHNIVHVVMEATGVYWITLYSMLEEAGFKVRLVNGREVKNLPGRKSDVADCQWLRQLHTYGLLKASYVPDDKIRELRTYRRLRSDHIQMASTHIKHMQKALELMNIKLHNVISKINGVSGMRIINAILAGERSPELLAEFCENSILKNKREKVIASLKGNYKEEYLFLLKQAKEAYEFYQIQIEECDKQIEKLLNEMTKDLPKPDKITLPKPIRHNKPKIDDLHTKLMILTEGKDPSRITGLTDKLLLELISETGINLKETWPTDKHFTSWLKLAPGKHQSGKVNKKRRLKAHTRAGQIFMEAALSIANSKYTALSGFYRRIKAKKGFKVALKATARKIAVLYYNIMTEGIDYVEEGLEKYQERFIKQRLSRLKKQAKYFGLELVPIGCQ